MSRVLRTLVLGTAGLALLAPSAASASGTGGNPYVVDRETVQAELTPSGTVDVARLFSQLTVIGDGKVVLADPTSGKGIRNLDGFGAPTVRDGKALYTIDVHGTAKRRTVSDFTGTLPVTVKAVYRLDGKVVRAQELVGKSGYLQVAYTVTNVTGTPTIVSWQDGKGAPHSKTIDLVTPYVGQLTTTLPSSFTEVDADRADIAADGHGGALLSWTMVLFSPIGETTQTFGYGARISDGKLPAATVQVVPVPPSKKPELAFGQEGFKEGAVQATGLTFGAGQIDANLLKLQNGASELLTGLTQLAAGASTLRAGLAGQLAPGATALAAGTGSALAGSTKLKTGVDALAAGAGKLAGGLGTAASGSTELAAGLGSADEGAAALADGLDAILAGVQDLPDALKADPGYQQLLGALSKVQAGIGTATDVTPTTVLGGLNLLRYGLRSPLGVSGCDQTAAPGSPTACGAADGVELVQTQLAEAVKAGGKVDQLIGAAKAGYASAGCPAVPGGVTVPVSGVLPPTTPGLPLTCVYLSSLAYGLGLPAGLDPANALGGLKAQTALASATLEKVFEGIDDAILPGVGKLKLALSNPTCDLTKPQDPANPCGIAQVQTLVSAGIGTLVAQVSAQLSGFLSTAADGAADLADGTALLAAGSDRLAGGLGLLDAGAQQLADGTGAAAAGAGSLTSGLGKLDTGAGQLAAGLDKAAAGSGRLAEGLDKAAAGDRKVVAGAGELRKQGTSLLIAGGNDTASVNAERYATLQALGAKADDGALPYGAPKGATGSAAYSLTLAAATSDTRDNTTRGLVALVLLAASVAVSWGLRRRLAR